MPTFFFLYSRAICQVNCVHEGSELPFPKLRKPGTSDQPPTFHLTSTKLVSPEEITAFYQQRKCQSKPLGLPFQLSWRKKKSSFTTSTPALWQLCLQDMHSRWDEAMGYPSPPSRSPLESQLGKERVGCVEIKNLTPLFWSIKANLTGHEE